MRLKTTAYLKATKIPIVIDLGFGDAITAPDYEIDYGSLLDMPSATVRAYSPETVMAEKFRALIALGIVNSRMKDFYELYAIPLAVEISQNALFKAIKSTFLRRETDLPPRATNRLFKSVLKRPHSPNTMVCLFRRNGCCGHDA